MAPPRSNNRKAPEEAKRKVLKHYFDLKSSLHLITTSGNQTNYSSNDALDDINGIGEYLSSQIEPLYYNEINLLNSKIATRVFETPELLEMILDYTSFTDILHMSKTRHGVRDVVYASSKLRARLFLQPTTEVETEDQVFKTPFFTDGRTRSYRFRDYKVTFETELGADTPPPSDYESDELSDDDDSESGDKYIYITFEEDAYVRGLPRISVKWKNILISQPPLKVMEMKPECTCFGSEGDDITSRIVRAKNGFTLQNLFERAEELFDEGCMWCKLHYGEEELEDGWEYEMDAEEAYGQIKAPLSAVSFKAIVSEEAWNRGMGTQA